MYPGHERGRTMLKIIAVVIVLYVVCAVVMALMEFLGAKG
jgi:hypothetical protein